MNTVPHTWHLEHFLPPLSFSWSRSSPTVHSRSWQSHCQGHSSEEHCTLPSTLEFPWLPVSFSQNLSNPRPQSCFQCGWILNLWTPLDKLGWEGVSHCPTWSCSCTGKNFCWDPWCCWDHLKVLSIFQEPCPRFVSNDWPLYYLILKSGLVTGLIDVALLVYKVGEEKEDHSFILLHLMLSHRAANFLHSQLYWIINKIAQFTKMTLMHYNGWYL